jgi:hypothetical protein
MKAHVLDLFSGLGGWAEGFRAEGFDVTTLDLEPKFGCDITADVRTWKPDRRYEVIVASPPCEYLSTLTFQRGYFKQDAEGVPRPVTDQGHLAIELFSRTWDLVRMIKPRYYILENPRALARQVMSQTKPVEHERHTVWYCHYGLPMAKPTDLWGRFPATFTPEPKCHNRRGGHPKNCCCHDHNAAPRGSRSGTQGPQSAAERAKVPFELSNALARAITKEEQGDG